MIRGTGYEVGAIRKEPYKKKRTIRLSSLAAAARKEARI